MSKETKKDSENTKLLEQIISRLDTITETIKKTSEEREKTEKASREEEKKLQIDIANIQADIQMWLGLTFGFVALIGGFLIGGYQIEVTSTTNEAVRSTLSTTLFFLAIPFGFMLAYSVRVTVKFREELRKLYHPKE